jgi:RNA polymerase-interacting CarD/CdnL/TRCF family regulator
MSAVREPKFAVNDLVVYASHGVGRVTSRRHELVKLEFERGLSVTLPVARAVECVRPVSTEVELAGIGKTLGGSEVVTDENWQRRLKTTRSKVAGGEAASLAEVVRDASRREERASARTEPSRLSLTERQLYVTARKLLADEIAAARGIDAAEADAWIGDQLARNQDHAAPITTNAPAAATTTESSGNRARRRRH